MVLIKGTLNDLNQANLISPYLKEQIYLSIIKVNCFEKLETFYHLLQMVKWYFFIYIIIGSINKRTILFNSVQKKWVK